MNTYAFMARAWQLLFFSKFGYVPCRKRRLQYTGKETVCQIQGVTNRRG